MLATECPTCGGSLRYMARWGCVVALRCRSCGGAYQQRVPTWYADLLAAA